MTNMYLYSSSGNLTMFPLRAVALNIGLGIWRLVVLVGGIVLVEETGEPEENHRPAGSQ